MTKQLLSLAFSLCLAGSVSTTVMAAEHSVLMLNSNATGIMAFEPALLNVAVGDTVKFIPKELGHNAESVANLIPAGATPFKGDLSTEIIVTIEQEGVYVIQCDPHSIMAMVAVIVAGKPTNLADIKAKAADYATKFVMNKERLNNILAQIK